MAITQARIGFGALLKRGDGGSPEVFTTVTQVIDIDRLQTSLATVDGTHMESPDAHLEKIAGLLEAGPVSVRAHYLPGDTQQNLLRSDQLTRTLRNWEITIPGSTKKAAFSAFVGEWGPTLPHDNSMMCDFQLVPSGKITIA